ncbi:transporter substrate-binding domain-containing protein [Candidatus Marifrigoribacter sp. Uisw_064]|jgi:polar amino acid transport system substrate-binding protein|uniref:transporter substrate-binding domain-containing protein n=1 Tax=Candidatus Marifrigoribacter sp. Uisw_064 TaxID=3230970 RepID=UPI003D4C8D04
MRLTTITLLALFLYVGTYGQTKITSTVKDTLKVGIAGSEPFVFNEKDKGIAIEIWKKIAENQSWEFEYVPFESVENAVHQLNDGGIDLVVGPISITSKRLENMRFSQPFYNSSISILSRIENQSVWQKIKPLFSLKLLMAIFIFLFILAVVGTFLWLAERKKSPEQFPKDPLKGIGTGMWLAIVTMTTTGYGDKAPITLPGRIITGAWMILSIIFATSMVAGIASTLTLSSLESTTVSTIEQLSGAKAVTISGSPTETFLKKSNIKAIGVNNLNEAIAKLKSKEVDAVVYDRPQLLYFLKNNNNEDLYISKAEYYKQGYGFAFPLNSELMYDVNRALLMLAENQETERIIHYYIQKDE